MRRRPSLGKLPSTRFRQAQPSGSGRRFDRSWAGPGLRTPLGSLRLGGSVWLVTLVAGLGLLVVVGPYLGIGRSAPEAPSTPTNLRTADLEGPATGAAEPATPDSFLRDYDAPAHDQAILTSSGPTVGEAVSFLAKFGLILILLYVSLRALRSFMLRQRGTTSSSAQIEILETRYLSSNRALYLVGAGPKVLLLGGTDQQVTLLAELADVDLEDGGWKEEKGWKGEEGEWRVEDRKREVGDGSLS
ncbi:MAG: flagellar biosynthetic protein FliO [Anaerolineae bacterium]